MHRFGAFTLARGAGAGAPAVLALIAAYALIVGLTDLTVAIGGERVLERRLQPTPVHRAPVWV
jgi:hypothetical protein